MSDLIIRFLAGVVIVSTVLLVCLIRICCEHEDEANQEKPIDIEANKRRRYRGSEDPEDLSSPPVTIHLLSEFMNIHQHLVTPVLPMMTFSQKGGAPNSTSPAKEQRKVHFKKNPSYQSGHDDSQEESVQMINYAQTSFITTKESQVDVHPPPTLPSPATGPNLFEENDIPIRKPSSTEIELSDSLKISPNDDDDEEIEIPLPHTKKRPPLKRGYSLFSKRRSLGNETNLVAPGIAQMTLKAKLRRIHLYGKDHRFYPRSVDNILVWVQKNDFDYETEQWKLFWQEELKNETLGANRSPHCILHSDSFLSFSSVTSTSPNFKDTVRESKIPDEIDEKELSKQHGSEVLL